MKDLEYFVKTVELKSMSNAAVAFDVLPATISAAIKRLETEYGQTLLIRSTRSLRLTEQGEVFFRACQAALNILAEAQHDVSAKQAKLKGSVYISAPSDFGRNRFRLWIDELLAKHPLLCVHLQPTDVHVDFFQERMDFAIRYGTIKDSTLVARELCKTKRILCASPQYLRSAPPLEHPEDIKHHEALCLAVNGRPHKRWPFYDQNQFVSVEVSPRRFSDDGELVKQWAMDGKGLAYKTHIDILKELEEGSLVRCLPDWVGEAMSVHLVYPKDRQHHPKNKAIIEFLVQKAKEMAPYL